MVRLLSLITNNLWLIGSLGYGYSHQLHGLNDKSPHQQVEDSSFFRLPGLDVSNLHCELVIVTRITYVLHISHKLFIGAEGNRRLSPAVSHWSSRFT